MIVNAPDRLPSGDRVVRHVESRRNWPIVDLSYGQVSARRRHAAGISVRCCDSLTDMETCYRCCRGKVYTLVVAGSTGPMSSIIVRSHPNPRYPTDNPQAVPGQPKTAKRTKNQRSNRSTVKRANELNIPQSTIHTPQLSLPRFSGQVRIVGMRHAVRTAVHSASEKSGPARSGGGAGCTIPR